MNSSDPLLTRNLKLAKERFGPLTRPARQSLRFLTTEHSLSLAAADLLFLEGKWYVTNSGLLRLARNNRCAGIHTEPVRELCDPGSGRWVMRATVFKNARSKGFVGYGDADPSNIASVGRGSEMRVAETRAVNRALRKAYGIGLCSVEEISPLSRPEPDTAQGREAVANQHSDRNGGAHPLRDRLCLLIRKYALDAELVKLYATDFCGTRELRQARREQVAEFITHLAQYAEHDRDGLRCRLNSYGTPAALEVKPPQEEVAGAA